MAGTARGKAQGGSSGGSGRKAAIAAAALLLAFAVAWWSGLVGGVDPEVAALEKLQQTMFREGQPPSREQFQEFRQRIDGLSEAQRQQFFQRNQPPFLGRMRERMNALFAMPPQELQREVRAVAGDIIKARQGGDSGSGPGGPGGPGGGGPGGGGPPWRDMSPEQRDAMAKRRLDFADPTMRAQFGEFRRMVNDELKSQGQPPLEGRDMRAIFRRQIERG